MELALKLFPYDQAYPQQHDFMQKMIECINNKKIGIFESPTGTVQQSNDVSGKTLSLLCAAIAYQQRELFEDAEKENDMYGENWIEAKRNELDGFGTIDPLTLPKRLPKKRTRTAKKVEFDLDDNVKSLLQMLDSESEKEGDGSGLKGRKIYFCSRTHSQLSQAMGELDRIIKRAAKLDLIKEYCAITLGSRANLCVNKQVTKLSSVQRINDKCLELQANTDNNCCPYYNSEKEPHMKVLEESLKRLQVADIEESHKLGEKVGACAYYAARSVQQDAQLVTIPYNVLLQKEAREAFGIDLSGAIVIIDEAHNLIDAINSIYSLTIHAIEKAQKALSTYLDKYGKRLSPTNSLYIQQLLNALSLLIAFKGQVKESTILGINDFLHEVRIDNLNIFPIEAYLQESRLSQKISGFYEDGAADPNLLNEIVRFLILLANSDYNGRVNVIMEKDAVRFKYVSLNPETYFQEIVDQTHSVILAGGTMSPSTDFVDMLFEAGPVRERITQFNCGHLIPKENCLAVTIAAGPTGIPLEFSYASRASPSTLSELGQTIINLVNITPDGVVCFFPSYAYMEDVLSAWKSTKVLETLESKKKIVIEGQGSGLEELMESYRSAVLRSTGGGLLFGVMGGRLSEGINFSDKLARLVIVVGMPFPNIHDPETAERVNYFVNRKAKLEPGLDTLVARSEYLENLCMRSVNQTLGTPIFLTSLYQFLGRVIRHKDDFAAMVLIDSRYRQPRIASKISAWIRPSLQPATDSFGQAYSALAKVHENIYLIVHNTF